MPGRALTRADDDGWRSPSPSAGPVEAVEDRTTLAGLRHLPPHRQVASPLRRPAVAMTVALDGAAAAQLLADTGGQLWPEGRLAGHHSPQPLHVQLHRARAAHVAIHQPQPGGSWGGREGGEGRKPPWYRAGQRFLPLLSGKSPKRPRLMLRCRSDAANAAPRDGALTSGLRGGGWRHRWGLEGGFHGL